MIKVVCAILVRQKEIFIAQLNKNSDRPLLWEFPGGKIEKEETEEEALKREIKEELNVEIEIIQKLISAKHAYPAKTIELIPFLCKIITGNLVLAEHADYKWISLNDLSYAAFSAADKKLIQQKQNKLFLEKYFRK